MFKMHIIKLFNFNLKYQKQQYSKQLIHARFKGGQSLCPYLFVTFVLKLENFFLQCELNMKVAFKTDSGSK